MAAVALKGMKFYAFHGYYEFERRVGNNFILDVEIDIDMNSDPDDQIDNTVNYEEVYTICAKFMQKKYSLLESVVFDIGTEIKSTFKLVNTVEVSLSKLSPPVGGKVDRAVVTVTI